jgi:hypothetical protein
MNYQNQVIYVIHNWLADRSAFVKVDEEVSIIFNVSYVCVQGSLIGTTLFSILLRQLGHIYSDMIKYAEDALFFLGGDDW